MYSACEIGMRVSHETRRSIFSSVGSLVVGRKYCDDVRNSLAACRRDGRVTGVPRTCRWRGPPGRLALVGVLERDAALRHVRLGALDDVAWLRKRSIS